MSFNQQRSLLRRLALLLCLLLPAALLSGCGYAPPPGENAGLLRAPMLNAQQREIFEALSATLDPDHITYVYPQNSEGSSFVFHDMDGDGREEAVVFYTEQGAPGEARAKILRQDSQGGWYSFRDIAGSGDEVEFVEFAHLLSADYSSMLVGWNNAAGRVKTLGVYSLRDGRFVPEYQEVYTSWDLFDYNGDDREELVLARNSNGRYVLTLLGGSGGALLVSDEMPLNADVYGILQMLRGRLPGGGYGLYVDQEIREQGLGGTAIYGTEVIRVTGTDLETIAGVGLGASGEEVLGQLDAYYSTFREEAALSVDLGGDGTILVPRLQDLPGARDDRAEDSIRLTEYRRLTPDGSFSVRYTAVVNREQGYLIFYPARWLGTVTLVDQPEYNQWTFSKVNLETGEASVDLFRIRTYSILDPAIPQGDIFLGSKGVLEYYGFIPETQEEPLAITEEEARQMFALT